MTENLRFVSAEAGGNQFLAKKKLEPTVPIQNNTLATEFRRDLHDSRRNHISTCISTWFLAHLFWSKWHPSIFYGSKKHLKYSWPPYFYMTSICKQATPRIVVSPCFWGPDVPTIFFDQGETLGLQIWLRHDRETPVEAKWPDGSVVHKLHMQQIISPRKSPFGRNWIYPIQSHVGLVYSLRNHGWLIFWW